MKVTCRKCGTVQPLEDKVAACPSCRTVLRRCVDCSQFDIRTNVCRPLNRPIPAAEIHYPSFGAQSTYCRTYVPSNPAPE